MSGWYTTDSVDVVIVGGGPAGLATACTLVRHGRSALVLELSSYESPRIGETFPPEIRLPLDALGLWDGFLETGHSTSPGIQSVWGNGRPYDNDFLSNPYGSGWHVDRRRFDAGFAESAQSRGVIIHRNARPTALNLTASGAWRLEFVAQRSICSLSARMLVDATGSRAVISRRLGDRRLAVDRMVGLIGFFDCRTVVNEHDQRTLIEAVSDGWWYSALLPTGHHIAGFMTDPDLLPHGTDRRLVHWESRLRTAPITRSRLDSGQLLCPLKVVPAGTSCLRSIIGEHRIAVGDAAASLDPLSSQGVYRALILGIEAASVVDARLNGDSSAFTDYARRVHADFAVDLNERAEYYQREQRWPDAPFWKRRHRRPQSDPVPFRL